MIIRTITILNPYNLNTIINFIKTINNYRDYSYFYKGLNKLVLYESDLAALSGSRKVAIAKFGLEIIIYIITIIILA
ncbi:hypothetical protein C8035_v010982 [Colletotrichum spinosum]|uniref:Uncharacterized protein n=1 Tax=Colletotrichum spinosum TaxID=1347390 RepID=A0A4R8Q0P0_9PEZI|nr:hypothetical protein C8035_v010982 [Colletotrichum spinosum]